VRPDREPLAPFAEIDEALVDYFLLLRKEDPERIDRAVFHRGAINRDLKWGEPRPISRPFLGRKR